MTIPSMEMLKSKLKSKPKPPTQQQQQPPSEQQTHFKPSSDVKGLRFGTQFLVRSFTVRRAPPLDLLRLLRKNTPQNPNPNPNPNPFPSTTTYLPTNFTILAHHALHTLTLGLGTNKSKAIVFVFESASTKSHFDQIWPPTLALGEVNRRLIRGLTGFELARFKFRKGAVTFYVYAVRKIGAVGFGCAADLRVLLESMVEIKDFVDHTAMLALPTQRSVGFEDPNACPIDPIKHGR